MPDLPAAAITAAAEAIERELMSGTGYGTHVDADEALARAALNAAMPILLREFAWHVLLVDEIEFGYRCPACHGKPARWKNDPPVTGRRIYQCGCGKEWSPKVPPRQSLGVRSVIRAAAEGKPVPPLPPKENGDA